MKKFNVIIYDVNSQQFKDYDVIPYFVDKIKSQPKAKRPTNDEELKKSIDGWAKYQFWSRCEYEIILTNWPSQNVYKKIDVYHQISMNLDIIVQIVKENL